MATPIDVSLTNPAVVLDANAPTHYVDWGAILAGAFVAAAISSVFLAFGSALGLTLTAMVSVSSASVTGLAIAAALWLLWVQVSSFIGGGYVAGRMRRRIGDAKPHEVEMRDGGHGLIVWAVGVVIAAMLTGWAAMAGVANVAGNAATADYHVARLLRTTQVPPPVAAGDARQLASILAMSLRPGPADADDRAFAAREIAARTGLTEPEAQQRFDETVATLKSQANTARKYGILVAFLTAASLLVGAVAAWWAACAGGRHRDQGVDHSHLSAWR